MLLLAAGAGLLPAVMHLDASAYPREPGKQSALNLCSRSDPTFMRFLESHRAACYERIANSSTRAANIIQSPKP